jgi:hypothetical protein
MSKFLKMMEERSRKPSPPQQEPVPELPVPELPVPNLPVPELPVPELGAVFRPTSKPVYARTAQDGHTSGEQHLYAVMHRLASPSADGHSRITIGTRSLAKLASTAHSTCQANLRSLQAKLSIECAGQQSDKQTDGQTWIVFGYVEILNRRREAGMTHVERCKGAVRFVPQGVPNLPVPELGVPELEISRSGTGSSGIPSLGTPVRKLLKESTKEIELTSSSERDVVSQRALLAGCVLDAAAAGRILDGCRAIDPQATAEEIAALVALKIGENHRNPNVRSRVGLLIKSVPKYFDPPATFVRELRNRAAAEKAEAQRLAASILEDPESSEADRAWAKAQLPPGG